MDKHSATARFLQEVFPDYGTHAIFAHSVDHPDPDKRMRHVRSLAALKATRDCYWSVAAFKNDGRTIRRKRSALEVRCLVIDDVGTKIPEALVRKLGTPTAVVESSFMNFQWVYRLSSPVPVDEWRAFALGVIALLQSPHEPEGLVNPVMLFRLPMGVNCKPERGGFSPLLVGLNAGAVLDIADITPVGGSKAKASQGPHDGRIKNIKGIVALVPNNTDYHGWMARMHQIWVLAKDKTEGREAFREYTDRFTGIVKEDTDAKWESIREDDITTAGQLLLEDACRANPDEFARIMNAEADEAFDDGAVPPDPTKPAVADITATPFKWVDLARTAPRDWLYGDILLRKFISMTVAPGGVGKSSLVAVETLAQVTGKSLLGDDPSGELRVWLWNLEDPYEETQKKLLAAAKHYGIAEEDIGDRLFVDSGRDQRLVVAEMQGSTPRIVRPVVSALVEQIRLRRIDVVVIDPFVSCHGVPENDNTAQDMVVKEWGRVAEEGNCAVHLVDHTSKAGSKEVVTNSSRGAVAKTDAARVVRVVNRMTDTDSRAYGVLDGWRYFNTFNDKANMAPPKARRDWFRMESVWAGNGGGAAQAFSVGAAAVPSQGDSIGVAVQWTPPSAQTMAGGDAFMKVVKVMGTRRWKASAHSKKEWIGNAVAQGLQLDASVTSERETIKAVLKKWLKDGLLKIVQQQDEHRNKRDYIEIAQVY